MVRSAEEGQSRYRTRDRLRCFPRGDPCYQIDKLSKYVRLGLGAEPVLGVSAASHPC